MNSSVGNSQPKVSHDKLRKTPDGTNYVKWLDKLKEDFSSNSVVSVKQFGPDLLRDQASFQARFVDENRVADDSEKVGLLGKKSERQNAVEIIFNLIMSKLSEEVKQLVEADTEYAEMRDNAISKGPYKLLAVIRKVVNSGITSDVTYQNMVNVKALHDVRQTAKEPIIAYVERLKGARDIFLCTTPHGMICQAPDMMAKVVTVESMSCQWTLHFGSYNDRTTVFNQVEVLVAYALDLVGRRSEQQLEVKCA